MQTDFNISDLVREAQGRWLKPIEVHFVIQNCEDRHLLSESAEKPPSGSVFLYNRRVLRNFRTDGHNWRKKKDGRTVGEAHERLKVGNVEALNCYYAHGEENPSFQRRSFWMLSGERDHIVLVQYLNVSNDFSGSAPRRTSRPTSSSSMISRIPSETMSGNLRSRLISSLEAALTENTSAIENVNSTLANLRAKRRDIVYSLKQLKNPVGDDNGDKAAESEDEEEESDGDDDAGED